MQGFLQLNIDELVDWSSKWQIDLNFKKCSVMHLGPNNPEFEYTMINATNERIELKSSRVERDLGVNMSSDMKWTNHI